MSPTARVGRLQAWLESIDLGHYTKTFLAHDIDFSVLADLTDGDLRELGVTLGHRKRLLREIHKLEDDAAGAGVVSTKASQTPTAERRRVTIVFSDLVGSTHLAVRYDPEDLSNVILAYQNCCEQVIRRWGGHVLNYLGDGVVSCFGYPVAHEDSAERAVRAALEIVQEVGALRPIDDLRMETRIGIATGEVVIGDLEGDESVAGETPNLAARLQNLAKPDRIVISGSTRRLVGGIFELDSMGKHELKGFAEPLEVWQIKGEFERASRFEARHRERRLSHIGRDAEMATLRALWEKAKGGEGQVAIISGEAGIGKSHLCEALRLSIADEQHTRLRCFCAPFHQNSVLYPIINQLERAAGFVVGDDNATKLAKLEGRLQVAKNGPSQATALIAALLSIKPDHRYAPLAMTSQRQRIETIGALLEEIHALAEITPLFMVFEDVHWSDPTSLEVLTKLSEDGVSNRPILHLITHRPDFRPSIGPAAWIHDMKLDRIEAEDSHKIVADIAQSEGIPERLVADIVSKSDGVPLFIEELTKAVLEMENEKQRVTAHGGGAQSLAVPDTLHDSLMARLDRLQSAKPIAQLGAVIGRRFIHGVLSAVAGMEEPALREALGNLVKSELVQCHGEAPAAAYTFKHVLIQEAAYSSLLRSRVRQLHGEIADVLEHRFPDMAHAEPEVLANHFLKGGMPDKAADCLMDAGRQATSRAAQTEAINHFSAALAILEDQPQTPEREQKEIRLRALLGSALIAVKGYAADDVRETFQRAHDLCIRQDDNPMLCSTMYGLWVVNLARSDRKATVDWAKRLLDRFGSSEDLTQRIGAVFANGITSFYRGDFKASAAQLDQVLALYWTAQHDELIQTYSDDLALFALAQLQWLETLSGDVAAARAREHKALDLAERLNDPISITRSLVFAMMHHHDLRNVDGAEQMAERALDLGGKHIIPFWTSLAQCGLGWAMAEKGDLTGGIETIEQGLAFFDLIDQKLPLTYWNAYLIEALMKAGDHERAGGLIDKTLKLAERNVDSFYRPALLCCKGNLQQTAAKDLDAAEASFRKARSLAYRQRAALLDHRATVSLATLLLDTDQAEEAKTLLLETRKRSPISNIVPDHGDGEALLACIG
ncbi:MAG: adenylate/guanylate cyclase domain-containing protein [Alphaproteobacteria bacterium]